VSFGWNGSRLTGTFDLAADTGAILQAALNEARDALFHDGLTDLTWADALAQRSVPTRLRNLITHRDQSCQIPGCTATHTQIHHIIHWTNGGTTNPENLISICARHHRAHHLGLIGIQGNANQPDTMIFTDQHGNPINTTPQPIITTPTPASPQPVYEHPSGERLNLTHFAGWNHPTVKDRHNTTWHQHQQRTRLTETTDEDHHAA